MSGYWFPACMIIFILAMILGGLVTADYYLIKR